MYDIVTATQQVHTRTLMYELIAKRSREKLHLQAARALRSMFPDPSLQSELAPLMAHHCRSGGDKEQEIKVCTRKFSKIQNSCIFSYDALSSSAITRLYLL